MRMTLTTPALLFPAISLLLLAYTNRFHVLANLIRQLHPGPESPVPPLVMRQIRGLRLRIMYIKWMQSCGVFSFLLCALSMFALFLEFQFLGELLFSCSILALAVSLVFSLIEVLTSTNALSIVLEDLESRAEK